MFVVFEGLDSSGKKTQARLLKERFEKEGKKTGAIEFPSYKSDAGKIISEYLQGALGKKEDMPPEIGSMLYAIDRYHYRGEMLRSLKEGNLIADRYTYSNIFQAAKLPVGERDAFVSWAAALESRLPKPDVVIFLDMPPETGRKLGHSEREYLKGKKYDIHEEDLEYQKTVRETYLDVAQKQGWIIINCVDNNNLKTPEQIHEEIWESLPQ
jgi:dTMP kinase